MSERETPLTVPLLAKIVIAALAVVGPLVSGLWWLARLEGEIASVRQSVDANKADRDMRFLVVEREIAELHTRSDTHERTLGEMARKLDVAVAILERMETRSNGVKP